MKGLSYYFLYLGLGANVPIGFDNVGLIDTCVLHHKQGLSQGK